MTTKVAVERLGQIDRAAKFLAKEYACYVQTLERDKGRRVGGYTTVTDARIKISMLAHLVFWDGRYDMGAPQGAHEASLANTAAVDQLATTGTLAGLQAAITEMEDAIAAAPTDQMIERRLKKLSDLTRSVQTLRRRLDRAEEKRTRG